MKHELVELLKLRDARIAELEKRLFECESAMLLGHESAMLNYMTQYPEPIPQPAS